MVWKKGESGNCGGKAVVPYEIQTSRKLTRMVFEQFANHYLFMTAPEIRKVMEDTKTSAIELMICQIIVKGAIEGSFPHLEFFLNRLLGPMKKEITLNEETNEIQMLTNKEVDEKLLIITEKLNEYRRKNKASE